VPPPPRRRREFASLAEESDDFKVEDARVSYGSALFSDTTVSLANFDGVFCQNDRCIPDVYRIAVKKGLRVPEDVSVVGCNNRAISSQLIPSATTVDIRKVEIGRDIEELKSIKEHDRTFEPDISEKKRDALLAGWRETVERCL